MAAGADFIKTSTGKVAPAATLPVTLVMLEAIRDFERQTGRQVGMKPAGGIRVAKEAIQYLVVLYETLGPRWMTPDWFRFGASCLLNDVLMQIEKERTGRYQGPDHFTLDSTRDDQPPVRALRRYRFKQPAASASSCNRGLDEDRPRRPSPGRWPGGCIRLELARLRITLWARASSPAPRRNSPAVDHHVNCGRCTSPWSGTSPDGLRPARATSGVDTCLRVATSDDAEIAATDRVRLGMDFAQRRKRSSLRVVDGSSGSAQAPPRASVA